MDLMNQIVVGSVSESMRARHACIMLEKDRQMGESMTVKTLDYDTVDKVAEDLLKRVPDDIAIPKNAMVIDTEAYTRDVGLSILRELESRGLGLESLNDELISRGLASLDGDVSAWVDEELDKMSLNLDYRGIVASAILNKTMDKWWNENLEYIYDYMSDPFENGIKDAALEIFKHSVDIQVQAALYQKLNADSDAWLQNLKRELLESGSVEIDDWKDHGEIPAIITALFTAMQNSGELVDVDAALETRDSAMISFPVIRDGKLVHLKGIEKDVLKNYKGSIRTLKLINKSI